MPFAHCPILDIIGHECHWAKRLFSVAVNLTEQVNEIKHKKGLVSG